MPQNRKWKEAIVEVLGESSAPMHYTEIADRIVERKLRTDVGATPAATVAANIALSIQTEGVGSPFIRASRGYYALKNALVQQESPTVQPGLSESERSELERSEITGVVNAFGMYWDRSKVNWTNQPRILGKQSDESKPVNFCDEKGVYLLHDAQGVVYVGQTTDQTLGRRLSQHTIGRLNGRWDRFSWFGLYKPDENGTLETTFDPSKVTISILIATMEAVLIEGIEPRQNRKRGDDFKAIEYIQVPDPEFVKRNKQDLLRQVAAQIE